MRRWWLVVIFLLFALPIHAQDVDIAVEVRQFIRGDGDNVGIACYRVDAPQAGVLDHADERYPLASTIKIMTLGVYARGVAAGLFNPAERVSLDELDAFYLPRTDGGAHPAFLEDVQPDADNTLALSDVVYGMIRFSSNAAADYMRSRMADADYDAFYRLLGVENTDIPISILGMMLAQDNHEAGISEADLPRDIMRATAAAWAEKYVSDPEWRAEERAYRRNTARRYLQAGKSLIETQRTFFQAYDNEGTPDDFARVMATLLRGDILPQRAISVMRLALAWPMQFEANQERFVSLGTKGGSLPGTLTAAYFADPKAGDPLVLVVFYRDLSPDRYLTWIRSYDHQELEFYVLTHGCSWLNS